MFKVKYLNGNKKIIHYVNAYDISEVKFQYRDFKIIEMREVGKMSKILVEKDTDDKNTIWLKIPKGSAFYQFLMEGEFDDADKGLYREVMGVRERIKEI